MSVLTSPMAPSRLLNRRSALRLAFASVPAVAGFALLGSTNAAATSTVTPLSAAGPNDPVIEIIDAMSRSVAADAAAQRRALVPGTYRPGIDTTGPIAGTKLTRVDGDFLATADGQVIENLEVFGRINIKSFANVVVRNCVVWGTLATGTETSFVIVAGGNGRGLLIEDCRFTGRNNPWQQGMRGGNYTMRRTEISNMTDGISLTSQLGNVVVEGCWVHNGLYMEWNASTPNMPNQSAYYTHNDGVQFHCGKNYVFRGNMIGGTRVPGDHHTGVAAEIASGDDMYNAAFMIKQEVDNTPANRVENVLIENNWLAGGKSTINLTTGNDNPWSSLVIRNNRFIRSSWGDQLYILRGTGLGQISGNVFDDNGAAITVSKGY